MESEFKNQPADQPEIKFFKKAVGEQVGGESKLINKNKLKLDPKKMSNKLKKSKNIQRDLTEVYVDGDGGIPDLTRLDKEQRPFWKTVIYSLIIVLFILLVAAVAGFLVFSKFNQDNFSNEKVSFKIETPLTVVSGQETVYTVLITNKENVNLYNATLELTYPDNFEYLEANPAAKGEKNNLWEFSLLKVGETQKIEIKGKTVAALNSNLTFKGVLEFKPANMNATFKQEAAVDAKVASSLVNLSLAGPEKVLANQEIEYELTYQNLSEQKLTDLEMVVDYPEGFVATSAEPEAKEGNNNLWEIKELEAKAEGKIKIKGNYSATVEDGNREFKVRIQLKKNDELYVQAEQTLVTTIVKDQLNLQLIINGSAEDQPINFGDLLVYSLNYKNVGQGDLKNIKLTAHFNSQILDWESLNLNNKKGVVGQDTITWSGKEIPQLLKLSPGEEGTINWQLKVKDASSVTDQNISTLSVENYLEAQMEQTGEASGQTNIKSKTVVNSINSDLNLLSQVRYYNEDNIPLGSGPIKPKVGEKSSYNIRLKLSNNLHNVEEIKVVATMPKNIKWENKEDHNTGDLIYDSSINKVTWIISRLAKTARNTEASFSVSITPKEEDLGRILILVSGINLTAKDTDTGASINKTVNAMTTAFEDPILGQLSGIVE
ncbi:MAG: hypothetical protein WC518_02250 [Patescibacteria group bacterium]